MLSTNACNCSDNAAVLISIQLHMRQNETMDGLGLCGVVEALSALVVALPGRGNCTFRESRPLPAP